MDKQSDKDEHGTALATVERILRHHLILEGRGVEESRRAAERLVKQLRDEITAPLPELKPLSGDTPRTKAALERAIADLEAHPTMRVPLTAPVLKAMVMKVVEPIFVEACQLERELAVARYASGSIDAKDAARYRWLREPSGPASKVMNEHWYGEALDEAIDAGIALSARQDRK